MAEIFQSNFVFGLQGSLYQEFLDKEVRPIIQNIIGANDYEIIDFDKHLSKLDFDKSKRKESIFPEFYLNFLGDIIKENNIVSFKKKVCITLDERLCNEVCPNTNRKITTIKIGGVELAYFIYFDIREFFDFIYGSKIQESHTGENINNNSEKIKNVNNGITISKIQEDELIDKDSNYLLDESILPKLFSGKGDNNFTAKELVERIGYIHNVNNDRRISFIHDTKDSNTGFPIYHEEFPEIKNYAIGTPIKAIGCFIGDRFYTNDYEVIDIDELPFQVMRLSGTLNIHSTFAIIKTAIGDVYTSLNLIQKYAPNTVYQVKCVAIEAYDKKRQENGWKAIWVE